MENRGELLENLEKLHTTELGADKKKFIVTYGQCGGMVQGENHFIRGADRKKREKLVRQRG